MLSGELISGKKLEIEDRQTLDASDKVRGLDSGRRKCRKRNR